jgi:predicted metal-dependent hydrolase
MGAPPRYAPGRALPAQAYVPGRSPRPPAIEPAHGLMAALHAGAADAGTWQRHPAFLWGLDLYNHGFPWEAHEVWEALWQQAPRGAAARVMLQALIQCAAAVVHARAGRVTGRSRLAARALARLDQVQAAVGWCCLGIDVGALAQAMRVWALAGGEDWPRIALVCAAPEQGGPAGSG